MKRVLLRIIIALFVIISINQNLSAAKIDFVSATVSSSQTICAGTVPTQLTLNVTTCSGGGNSVYAATYQWQESDDNGVSDAWSAATGGSGSNSNAYSPPSLSNNMYYRCVITVTSNPAGCGIPDDSSYTTGSVLITVNPSPTTPGAITSNSPQCAGTGVTFTKGSCPSGTCYWVSSATGTETSNSAASFTTATTENTYNVWVRAYNGTCWSAAVSASGMVNSSPSITGQPANQSIITPANATFTVTATGGGLSYQWQENTGSGWSNVSNGGVYSGATTASLLLTSPSASMDSYEYRCVVTNSCGTATSDGNATLSVSLTYCTTSWSDNSDYITNVTFAGIDNTSAGDGGYIDNTGGTVGNVITGQSHIISVSVQDDAGTYSHQVQVWIDWNLNGSFLDAGEYYDLGTQSVGGAPVAFLGSISVPSGANVGNTRMRVTQDSDTGTPGPCANATYGETEDYKINVQGPPVIGTDPTNQSMCYNSSADFTVTATGLGTLTYQWQYQGSNVVDGTPANAVYTGATSSTLSVSGTITNATYSAYTCVVLNEYGSSTSAGADLTVTADVAPSAPTDLIKGDDLDCAGTSVTLSATVASGTLEWYSGSCSGISETSPVNPTETTTYYAKAYDSGTGCRSACAEITVNVLDEIIFIEEPEDQYGCSGESLTFSVVATGAGLTYQWQEDDGGGFTDITDGGVYSGAETMDLVISDVTGLGGYDYQCVVTGTCDTQNSAIATLSEISSGLSGTYTVGTTGDYATLKAAFDDINAFGLSGNTFLEVISNITETAEASLNEWVDCAGNSNYTVIIYPTVATQTISGNIATSLVTLNGADKVTIDGRIDMTGTANSLVFSNSNTSGATLEFTNAACNNTVQYATLQGASVSGTNGVVFFSIAGTTGNNNNSIMECDIRDDASEPLYGIYSVGTTGTPNRDNIVSGCNIYNFFENGSISRGIFLNTANTRWTLTGNSLYQTSLRTDGAFYGISINDSNGGEFMIEENYIGGTAPLCGGSQMTYNYSSSGIMFEGIIITCNSIGVSLIQDNVIKNIDFSSAVVTDDGSQYVIWTGIDIWAGRIDVIGNTIGDESTGSINVSIDEDLNLNSGTAWNNGIWHNGKGNVIDNTVGSITFDGTISTQCGFNAIEYVGTMISDQMISGNTVGHATTANSIQFAGNATPAMTMGGIYFGTDGDFLTTVARNTVANIDNGCTATNSFIVALNNQATAGNQIINGNEIYDISTATSEDGYYNTSDDFPAFAGIRTNNTASGADLSINNNHIYNISSTSMTASVSLFGVYCATATSGTHLLNGNNIHSFSTQNTSDQVWQKGLVLESGTGTISNNMIRLGVEGINSDNYIIGLQTATASSNSVLFNSVYIGGTSTSTQNTFAFLRSGTGTTDIRNNIFVNARTSAGGVSYAYYLNGIANLTSDYNIYSNNSGGVNAYAGALRTSLAEIQTGTSQDANSQVTDPLYDTPTGTGTACDLHIQTGSPAIGAAATGTGITIDIDPQERVSSGPCIGADENVTAPYGTDVYGIYSPDGINGTVEDVEIVSEGGAPGGTGYNVADPNEVYWPNVFISGYQVVTTSNISCTNSEFDYTTADASPDWLFGNGSDPGSSTSSPTNTEYSSIGYKDIIESVKVYNDFINITLESPEPGSILGAPSGAGCPTTYTYTSSEAGSAGYLYEWYATAPSGCIVSIDNPTASSTDITFVNQTGVDQIFLVTLVIETECCGKLKPVERYITIYPGPIMPEIDGGPFSTCEGGAQEVFILNPDPEYSDEWFDAETGGTQLGSGTDYMFTLIPEGITSYWVQSTNSFGCSSQRTEIQIEGIKPAAPVVDNQSTCGDSDVTFYINSPQAGYIYNWYTGSCIGTLLQSGTSTSFTYNVTGAETFYVSAIPPGCAEGYCATPSVTYLTPPDPIRWEGDDGTEPNDWFVKENWEDGCLPNCGTNVRIPTGISSYPEIGFHLDQAAAAKSLELVDNANLTFTDSKGKLEVCGNFIHSGDLITNDYGAVIFKGSVLQTYTRNATATGEFHNVKIDNAAPTPGLTVSSGDMIISNKGGITFVNGMLITGSNYLVVKNAANIAMSGHSKDSYVYGNLRRYVVSGGTTDYDFPVGTAVAYRLAHVNNNNMTGPAYFDVNFMESYDNTGALDPAEAQDAGTPYASVATEGVWQIDPDVALTGGSYDIQLYFDDGYGFQPDATPISNGFAGLVDNQFGVLKRPSNSSLASDWIGEDVGNIPAANAAGRIVTDGFALRSNITTFSEFGIGKSDTPLPIELSDFNADCLSSGIQLNWTTESESNNDYFTMYRSTDAETYVQIIQISGQGNSNFRTEYSFTDESYAGGPVYYKLRQSDFDGKHTESELVFINCTLALGAFYIVPNPFKEEVRIVFESPTDYPVNIQITDVLGHVVFQTEIPINTQEYRIRDLSQQMPGSYYLNLIYHETVITEKLIKM
ncbi:MAG: GEVED domain-containing protein [Bacteroidales bacterium]|nr:GEVED domain-containing protein [Bacteroidales bacterium]